MYIEKILIKNFKCFGSFELDLKSGINIIVGDNEVGKSSIIEAIHLALNGILNGKYLKNELTEYLFNKSSIEKSSGSFSSDTASCFLVILVIRF